MFVDYRYVIVVHVFGFREYCMVYGYCCIWLGKGVSPMFGDYEAQRHWQEITVNLPVKQW